LITKVKKILKKTIKLKEKDESVTIMVELDKESAERLKFLKAGLKNRDEDELIAISLKCLEQKVKTIIKKQQKGQNPSFNNKK